MKPRRTRMNGSTKLASRAVLIGSISSAMISTMITGCKREEIHSYSVPKEQVVAASTQEPSSAPKQEVTWIVPDAWQEVETTVQMRLATFETSQGLDVAVTAFPGDVGGLIANVNRWEGQVGLPSSNEQTINESIQRLEGVNVIIVDLAGESSRLIGSIIDVGDGKTWFAKVIGPAETVEQIKTDLVAFSASFHLHDSTHNHGNESQSEPQQIDNTPPIDWLPPEEWKAEKNASSILMAAFKSDSGARITLTTLGGQGGGYLSNINRWRGQLGMDMVDSMSDQPIEDLGNEALIVDLVSDENASRIMAGIVPIGGQTLFFKLTGSLEQTTPEIERFKAFVIGAGIASQDQP